MNNVNDSITALLAQHPFFSDCSQDEIQLISSCAKARNFSTDEYLAKAQEDATGFYLITSGTVAICTHMANQPNKIIQTIQPADIFGWSWLFPPYKWMFDAIAIQPAETITLDGQCVREKLQTHPDLGYKLMQRFSQMIISRLNATRLQLLDVYAKAAQS